MVPKTLGNLFSDATTAVAVASSRLVRRILGFSHRPPQRLWEAEEHKDEGRQEDVVGGHEAVGTHGLVHERPPGANHEV